MAYSIIVLGGGRMGAALVEGLLRAQWGEPGTLLILQRGDEKAEALRQRFPGVSVATTLEADQVDEHTGVVLCVKPDYAEGMARLCAAVGVRRLLSVVAGLTTERLQACFTQPVAVVRSMPNTPVLVGKGVTAITGGAHCTSADLEWAESILGSVGLVARVTERQIDAVSGLSGPMPAYLYLVVEALIEAGVHQGLSRDLSRQLVVGSFAGSAALLSETGESPEELRYQVTSPGGVTAAGLRVLESRAVRSAFLEAVASAAERSRSLIR
jgi:pyrroline-5-carboxylate reductase